jgi:hypothetical protein
MFAAGVDGACAIAGFELFQQECNLIVFRAGYLRLNSTILGNVQGGDVLLFEILKPSTQCDFIETISCILQQLRPLLIV